MSKKRIGDVLKSKAGKFYIKVNGDHQLKDGQYLNFDTKEQLIQDVQSGVEAGRLSEEVGNSMLEGLEKLPEWVHFRVSVS